MLNSKAFDDLFRPDRAWSKTVLRRTSRKMSRDAVGDWRSTSCRVPSSMSGAGPSQDARKLEALEFAS
jgi:hypothetical protein